MQVPAGTSPSRSETCTGWWAVSRTRSASTGRWPHGCAQAGPHVRAEGILEAARVAVQADQLALARASYEELRCANRTCADLDLVARSCWPVATWPAGVGSAGRSSRSGRSVQGSLEPEALEGALAPRTRAADGRSGAARGGPDPRRRHESFADAPVQDVAEAPGSSRGSPDGARQPGCGSSAGRDPRGRGDVARRAGPLGRCRGSGGARPARAGPEERTTALDELAHMLGAQAPTRCAGASWPTSPARDGPWWTPSWCGDHRPGPALDEMLRVACRGHRAASTLRSRWRCCPPVVSRAERACSRTTCPGRTDRSWRVREQRGTGPSACW